MKIKQLLFRGCCCLTIFIGITLITVQLFFLQNLIRSQAKDGIIMSNQTYGLWGIIPGDTQTFTLRNFTMYNFTNPYQFLYRSQGTSIPQFVQVGGFLYQQKSQFLNVNYSQDNTQINYDYWLYFNLLPQSKNISQKYTIINVAPLGFWMQLGTTNITSFTLQGFGSLFIQMNQTIKQQAIGQGISSTFISNYDIFQLICKQININDQYCWYLWNDRYYGIMNQVNLQFWVKAAYYKDIQTKQMLYQYFYPIPVPQFQALLLEISQLAETVQNILNNWYCSSQFKQAQTQTQSSSSTSSRRRYSSVLQKQCNSYTFTIKQLSSSGITNNPPPGSSPQQSICSTNSTCVGSPQIITYLHNQFKHKYPDPKYQSLIFSQQTFITLFTPYKGLLNIGTLNRIYQLGNQYDLYHQQHLLQLMMIIFNTQSIDHTFVIWQWIKYMTNQFVLKQSRGGSRQIAGLGGVFSQAWYQITYIFANWFLQDTYSYLIYKQIGSINKCILKLSQFLSIQLSTQICKQSLPDQSNYRYYYNIVKPCINLTYYYQFKQLYNIQDIKMQQYCDIDQQPSNIGLLTINIMQYLSKWYNCTQSLPTHKCTQLDIIIKQLFNSTITLNPLPFQNYPYYNKKSITVHTWNQQLPTFQYKYYLQISNIQDNQQHLQYQIRNLFTFDKLLNGPEIQQLFILENDVEFYHRYYWINPAYLRNYIRFIIIEVGFGGFVQQRSPQEVFFGYTDPFLNNLKQSNTMTGGDPSINSLIAFNQLNMTKQQSIINKQTMYTGYGDVMQTRQFVDLYNKTYIAVNQTYYDGQQVHWHMVSPWAEEVQLEGSDGFSVPPGLGEDQTPPVYISSIARFANVSMKQTINKFDMQLRDMRISHTALQSIEQNPQNAKYYQKYHSLLNSSYQGFPLFISKNHFLDADKKWSQRVLIKDINKNIMIANDWDDTRLYIQPYTGTAFSATVYLQSNYYYQPWDILFPSYQKLLSLQKLINTNNNKIQKINNSLINNMIDKFNKYNITKNMINKLNITNQQQLNQLLNSLKDINNTNKSSQSLSVNQIQSPYDRMLPIVNTFRSGNISENGVNKYFGDLRDIVNNKRKVALVGWILIALCFIILIAIKVKKINDQKNGKYQKGPREQGKKGSLLDSGQSIENYQKGPREQGVKKGSLLESGQSIDN